MKSTRIIVLIAFLTVTMSASAWAHFGMLIPSDSMVMQQGTRTIALELSFFAPF